MSILGTFEARAARRPGATLRQLQPHALKTVLCEGDARLYADDADDNAATHRREAWGTLLIARFYRQRARAALSGGHAVSPDGAA